MESPSLPVGALLPAYSQKQADGIYRKIAFRIVPLIFIAYVIAYIDRVNVGFAKLQFLQDLHFSEAVYGLGAGLFFIGYMLFEIPSNLLLEKIGARATLARIMITWGAISACMAFVSTPGQFYVMRFFLGAAEAGFFPGVILYLSYWFPPQRRARITAIFTIGGAAAGIVGGPLSGWLLTLTAHGLQGWQILFIYEGIPAILLGVFAYFYMDDKPAQVKWLSAPEKTLVADDLEAEVRGTAKIRHASFLQALRDPAVYAAAIAYVAVVAGTATIGFWAPTVLKQLNIDDSTIGLLTAVPFVFAVACMYLVSRSSDRRLERRWHYAVSMTVAGVSLCVLDLGAHSVVALVALLTVGACGAWAALPVFWTIPSAYLGGTAKAGGIAFISSVGAFGGFISPTVVGWVATQTGSVYFGLAAIGASLILSALILLIGVRPHHI